MIRLRIAAFSAIAYTQYVTLGNLQCSRIDLERQHDQFRQRCHHFHVRTIYGYVATATRLQTRCDAINGQACVQLEHGMTDSTVQRKREITDFWIGLQVRLAKKTVLLCKEIRAMIFVTYTFINLG